MNETDALFAEIEKLSGGAGTVAPTQPTAVPTPMMTPTSTMQPTVSDIPAAVAGQGTDQTWANWGASRLYDALMGVGLVGAGISDIVSAAPIAGANVLGANLPYFPASKFITERQQQAGETIGLQPSGGLQELISFLYPVSQAAKIPQVAAGLGAYTGTKLAEAIAPESTTARIVGGLAGGLIPSEKNLKRIGTVVGTLAGNESTLQNIASQKALQAMTPQQQEQALVALKAGQDVGVGGRTRTLAEMVPSQNIASAQVVLGQTPEGQQVFEPVFADSRNKLETALSNVGYDVNQTNVSTMVDDVIAKSEQARIETEALQSSQFGVPAQQGELASALATTAKEKIGTATQEMEQAGKELGLTDPIKERTQYEIGKPIQEGLSTEREAAKQLYKDAWNKVNPDQKVNLTQPMLYGKQALEQFTPPELGTNSALKAAQKRLKEFTTPDDNGKYPPTTVGDYQDILALLWAARKEAVNINDAKLIATVEAVKKQLLDVDFTTVSKVGGKQLKLLEAARQATKAFHTQWSSGIVGDIVSNVNGQYLIAAEKIPDRILKSTTNVVKLTDSFPQTHPAVISTRLELLNRLNRALDPKEFLAAKRTEFERLFSNDLPQIEQFVAKKITPTGYEYLRNITHSSVPAKVFENTETVARFVSQFKDTPILEFGRARFIDELLNKKVPLSDLLNQNDDKVKLLFGADYDRLKQAAAIHDQRAPLTRKEILKNPEAAAQLRSLYPESDIIDWIKQSYLQNVIDEGKKNIVTGGRVGLTKALQQRMGVGTALYGEQGIQEVARVIDDLDKFRGIEALSKQAAFGGSPTNLWRTTLGAFKDPGGFLIFLNQASNTLKHGGAYKTASGLLGAKVRDMVGGITMSAAGIAGANLTKTRIAQINRATAEIFANPKLLEAALTAPTHTNIKAFEKMLQNAGIITAKSVITDQEPTDNTAAIRGQSAESLAQASVSPQTTPIPTENKSTQDLFDQIMGVSEAAAQTPTGAPTPSAETQTIALSDAKTNNVVSVPIPVGDEYAPANVVQAVVQIESNNRFNVAGPAVRGGRAQGPMQLMPATANSLGVDASDPASNIEGGSRYVKQMHNRYGDWKLALAAYNWGPTNVSRNLRELKLRNIEPTWENMLKYTSVPKQTQNYVMKAQQLGVS